MDKAILDEIIYWIWLTSVSGIGPKTAHSLLELFESPHSLYVMLKDRPDIIMERGVSGAVFDKLQKNMSLEYAQEVLHTCNDSKIDILTIHHGLPTSFQQNKDCPILLYKKGENMPLTKGVGIIGARRCDRVSKETAIDISQQAVQNEKFVISGMAKGIDAYAHTAAIENGGFTVAVLGHGLDICYPREHATLKNRIQEQGMVLSEYPPGVMPRAYMFPQRNRIIAALSEVLHIVGAGNNSGTKYTAQAAEKYGAEIHRW